MITDLRAYITNTMLDANRKLPARRNNTWFFDFKAIYRYVDGFSTNVTSTHTPGFGLTANPGQNYVNGTTLDFPLYTPSGGYIWLFRRGFISGLVHRPYLACEIAAGGAGWRLYLPTNGNGYLRDVAAGAGADIVIPAGTGVIRVVQSNSGTNVQVFENSRLVATQSAITVGAYNRWWFYNEAGGSNGSILPECLCQRTD